jgi:Tol biopolymer transport system component
MLAERLALTLRQVTYGGTNDTDARWSPDGEKVAYSSAANITTPVLRDIKSINSDGTGVVNFTNSSGVDDTQPAWASAGR